MPVQKESEVIDPENIFKQDKKKKDCTFFDEAIIDQSAKLQPANHRVTVNLYGV